MGTYPPPPEIPPPPDPFKTRYDGVGPPRRRGWPVWATVVIIIAVLFFGGCGMLVLFIFGSAGFNTGNTFTGGSPWAPTAQVHVGTQLAWRDLIPPSGGFMSMSGPQAIDFTGIATVDLDGDGVDEVIVSDMYSREYEVYELDGTLSAQVLTLEGMLNDRGWDYDGDGTEELLLNQYNIMRCDVYDSGSQCIGTLNGEVSLMQLVTADVDGDGVEDLVLDDNQTPGNGSVSIYGTGGTRLWQYTPGTGMHNNTFGDINGDGADEIIFWDQGTNSLITDGLDSNQATYPAWTDYFWPTSCYDLDGNGIDEVFASNNGYLNVVTGQYVKLNYPVAGNPESDDPLEKVYLADLDRDGTSELVTIGLDNYSSNSGLFIFDLQGNCTYYEEMGDSIEEYLLVNDPAAGDYLIVLTDNRLLIYP